MDKKINDQKALHEQREKARIKALSDAVAKKVEANRVTTPDSPYRPFEESFGAARLKEINDFLFTLDEAEIDSNLSDPLFKVCQKFLDWKIEVGSNRLSHEFFYRYDEGALFVIKKAWEQVNKENEIIQAARLEHKKYLDSLIVADPKLPSRDPLQWCVLCDSFIEFDALQQFGYPLPFNSIFGEYTPKAFEYGKQDNSKLFEEQK